MAPTPRRAESCQRLPQLAASAAPTAAYGRFGRSRLRRVRALDRQTPDQGGRARSGRDEPPAQHQRTGVGGERVERERRRAAGHGDAGPPGPHRAEEQSRCPGTSAIQRRHPVDCEPREHPRGSAENGLPADQGAQLAPRGGPRRSGRRRGRGLNRRRGLDYRRARRGGRLRVPARQRWIERHRDDQSGAVGSLGARAGRHPARRLIDTAGRQDDVRDRGPGAGQRDGQPRRDRRAVDDRDARRARRDPGCRDLHATCTPPVPGRRDAGWSRWIRAPCRPRPARRARPARRRPASSRRW